MRVILRRRGLRRNWSNHPHAVGLLLEHDIRVGFSRLAAKLLIFRTRRQLLYFWHRAIGTDLGGRCLGAVNGLHTTREIVGIQPSRWMECDPRYYCIIGLTRAGLTMEIITHEAVHAAYCYAKRIRRSPWDQLARDYDEEGIAYPAGEIAAAINRAVHKAQLYQK